MKKVDAYGEELWDLYKGNIKLEIVERDDNFIATGNYGQVYFYDFKDWPAIEKKAMKFAKGKVLDVGCGAGRHSIYLQKKGFDVIGIDDSPLAIKVSRLRGLKQARILPIEKIDILKKKSFDTILMLGNNFGLFGSRTKTKQLLNKMHQITSDKALIIAQTRDPYNTKNKDHLGYLKWNRQRGRMSGQLRLRIRHRKFVGDWFDYLMVSQEEMKDLVKGTGWKIDRFISSKDSQYVAVIKKV
ncbi:MAG: methyltransferase domain-containing protein [Patescibacteria group bacterium]